MIDETKKRALINTIQGVGIEDPIVGITTKFIERYDGNDEEYLKLLCFAITGTLFKMGKAEIKAHAYNQIKKVRVDANEEIDEIKEIFEQLEAGILPTEPAVNNTVSKETPDLND